MSAPKTGTSAVAVSRSAKRRQRRKQSKTRKSGSVGMDVEEETPCLVPGFDAGYGVASQSGNGSNTLQVLQQVASSLGQNFGSAAPAASRPAATLESAAPLE
eukprot:9350749-Karenia_brevis.AAC.1